MHKKHTLLSQKENISYVIGSIDEVIRGQMILPPKKFLAKDFFIGFEVGSPSSIDHIGEALIYKNHLYSSLLDADRITPHQMNCHHGAEFVSNGFFGLSNQHTLNATCHYEDDQSMSLKNMLEDIFDQYKTVIVFRGKILFKQLDYMALTHAPIHNENLFEHKEKYLKGPYPSMNNTMAFVTGALTHKGYTSLDNLNQKMIKATLYNNPAEKIDQFLSHTHGLVYNETLSSVNDTIDDSKFSDVVHVYTYSQVLQAELELYFISDVLSLD
jgi:hypothetical protein